MSEIKLRVRKVSKTFKGEKGKIVPAIHNVTFDVFRGEFLSIVGPSGCGKTTLLRIITGLEKPDTGEVLLDGKKIEKPTPDIGFMFQMPSLYPWRTVLANVVLGLEIMGVPRTKYLQEAAHLLELVGLLGYEDMYPKELSGGQVQRVEIARALSTNPSVLLLDESLAHLDAQTRNYMQEELLDIWKKTGKTIIFVTHSVDEAVFLGDRVLLMSAQPGSIKNAVSISISRPRDRTSPNFVKIRATILEELKEEVLKTILAQKPRLSGHGLFI